ncbi:MAG: ATP-dependent metallopeptidase FtsH/Yme1/Tma family protein, partial [Caldilineaceae bacterium]|nr:ATP-dependent metallopeptidase FtsH/Yme1/Tma family protein [Caldilineaceae bacterium]
MASEKNTPPSRKPNQQNEPKGPGGNFWGRGWFWIILAVLILFGSRYFLGSSTDTGDTIGLNEVADHIANDEVKKITVQGELVTLEMKNS